MHHFLPFCQCRTRSHVRHPLTTTHKGDVRTCVHILFLFPHAFCHVNPPVFAIHQWTVGTFMLVLRAIARVVADAREIPHVVHRHHHGFLAFENGTQIFQGEVCLVDPVQMNHVGLLKFGQARHVGTRVGNVHRPQVGFLTSVVEENNQSLPNEFQREQQATLDGSHTDLIRLAVTHQHLCIRAIFLQGFHQSVGCNGSASYTLGCIDDEYSHGIPCS